MESFPDHEIHVFVKNDEPSPDDPLRGMRVRFTSVSWVPTWLRTPAMAIAGFIAALKERPELMLGAHLHFLPALRIIRGFIKKPYIGFLYGIEAWNLRSRMRIRAMYRADGLIAISRFTRDRVIEENPGASLKINVVPCTFDWGRFSIGPKPPELLKRYGLRPDQPVLLTVSRLAVSERYKGHRQVLFAITKVRKEFPDIQYIIAGDGDDLPSLKTAVAELDLERNVILPGQIAGGELPDHYRLCDLFIMPSTREGFGIVFLEAMATGKSTISGNVDGSTDAVSDGRLGAMVDPYDAEAIAKVVVAILKRDHPNRLLFDPQGLRDAVISQFGFPQVRDSLAGTIRDIWTGNGGNPAHNLRPQADVRLNAAKVLVVTQLTSPYQVEFFNAIAKSAYFHLEVIYLTNRDRARQWVASNIAHCHVILSERPELVTESMRSIAGADLVVFNYYIDWFTLKAIRERSKQGKPWVFWGERPGFLHTGILGIFARRFLLQPLHRQIVPIWGVGRYGVEGYQREFGGIRSYQNIPYFSDLKHFRGIERKSAAERVFFYSGSLSRRKGGDLLARAFAKIAIRHPKARLLLLGTGELEPQMRKELQVCKDRVTWLGFQPWEKLPECYALGTIFCFPSRYDGWGLALVEALASGMPSIGTDRAGAALEFLSEGEAGWLIEAGSGRALEMAMEKALVLPEAEFAAMQRAARDAVAYNGLQQGVRRFNEASKDVLAHWRAQMPGAPEARIKG